MVFPGLSAWPGTATALVTKNLSLQERTLYEPSTPPILPHCSLYELRIVEFPRTAPLYPSATSVPATVPPCRVWARLRKHGYNRDSGGKELRMPLEYVQIGDCLCDDALKVLPTLEENSIDAIITDPPYGLEFMGQNLTI